MRCPKDKSVAQRDESFEYLEDPDYQPRALIKDDNQEQENLFEDPTNDARIAEDQPVSEQPEAPGSQSQHSSNSSVVFLGMFPAKTGQPSTLSCALHRWRASMDS